MKFLFQNDHRLMTGIFEGRTTYGLPLSPVAEQFYEYPRWTRWCFHLSVAIICKFVDEVLLGPTENIE